MPYEHSCLCCHRTHDATVNACHLNIAHLAVAGRISGENARALQSIRSRLKDLDGMRVAEQELGLSFDYLEHAARMGMAALMLVSRFRSPFHAVSESL